MQTLMEELKPLRLVEYEFEHREKINFKAFLWKLRTIRILMEDKKKNGFLVEYLFTSTVFLIEILMEEIDLVVAVI